MDVSGWGFHVKWSYIMWELNWYDFVYEVVSGGGGS